MFSFSSLHSTGSNRYRAALSSDARFEVRILRRACVGPTRTLADAPRRPDRRAGRGLAARRFELCPLRGRAAVCGADAYRYWPTAGSIGRVIWGTLGVWKKISLTPIGRERYLLLPLENLSPAAPPPPARTRPTGDTARPPHAQAYLSPCGRGTAGPWQMPLSKSASTASQNAHTALFRALSYSIVVVLLHARRQLSAGAALPIRYARFSLAVL